MLRLIGSKLGEDVGMGVFVDGCWVVGDSVGAAVGVIEGRNVGNEGGCGLDSDGDSDSDGDNEGEGMLL